MNNEPQGTVVDWIWSYVTSGVGVLVLSLMLTNLQPGHNLSEPWLPHTQYGRDDS
jgi:hypothetical protein